MMMKVNIKKTICILLCIALTACSLCLFSCGSKNTSNEKITILCTVFPIYDWVCAVAGENENIEVKLLVENGTDLHSFQPSFGDMAKIKDSRIVIYIGGESDKWVAESIDERSTGIALSKLDGMTLYAVSSDSIANAHTHDGEECHEAHEHGFDEHIWLSVRNAKVAIGKILTELSNLDSANANIYADNAASYIAALDELDFAMHSLSNQITAPLIFADRFPFVYLLEDYGIDYFAAFEGCSADTGADFDTIITLAKKVDEYQSTSLFVTESPVSGLADGIVAQTKTKNVRTVSLDSMQSLGKAEIESGKNYLSIMKENINKLSAEARA